MTRWRIYYLDGTTWSDEDGPPEEAPSHKPIVGIVERNGASGRRLVGGKGGYYTFRDGQWREHDLPGALAQMKEAGVLKEGFLLSDRVWAEWRKRMESDPAFPDRSAYHADERR